MLCDEGITKTSALGIVLEYLARPEQLLLTKNQDKRTTQGRIQTSHKKLAAWTRRLQPHKEATHSGLFDYRTLAYCQLKAGHWYLEEVYDKVVR